MDRSEQLQKIFNTSGLPSLLTIKLTKYYPEPNYTALRFQSNDFRVRAIEIWDGAREDSWFRIYHSPDIVQEIKQRIDVLGSFTRKGAAKNYVDYFGDPQEIANELGKMLADDDVILIAKSNPVRSRKIHEGLDLPDVDLTDTDVFGRPFTWREIIAIYEDESGENELRKVLSKPGVYLQRSNDGTSRYVGSASSDGGILGRWISHLEKGGDANHLGFYVLENGYSNVLFCVLEFTEIKNAREKESRWKETLV